MTAIKSEQGSILGAALLIAGCCIGAGMLGLPVLTAKAGLYPSLVMLVVGWLFMMITGLLLAEVNLWYDDEVSIVSMAGRTLGTAGKAVAWGGFLFLFYTLMVAYVTSSAAFFSEVVNDALGLSLPQWIGSIGFAGVFGTLIYLGTGTVDWVNRLFMAGLIVAYGVLLAIGGEHVNGEHFLHRGWGASVMIVPAMIVSFGYHNLVPSLTYYLGRDRLRLRKAIVYGSTIPLVVYILWEWLILGIIPLEGEGGFLQALEKGNMATQALRKVAGGAWIVDVAEVFSFCAIVTSYLGVALSFVDFLADGLRIKKKGTSKVLLCGLVLVPSLVVSLTNPTIFLTALTYAGGFGAVALFGILPTLMVWKGRPEYPASRPLVPGGKLLLIVILVFAVGVFMLKLLEEINVL